MAFHVDDYQIRWKNFRGFRDTGWLTIRPLTILLGPNNAGKTSVIAPLLLMSQTVTSPDGMTPLITRGPLIDLGTFRDIVGDNHGNNSVFLGFKFHLHESTGKPLALGEEPPGVIEATIKAGHNPEDSVLQKLAVYDAFCRPMFTRTRRRNGHYDFHSPYIGRMLKSELPRIDEQEPTNFLFNPSTSLRRVQNGKRELAPSGYSKAFGQYLANIAFLSNELSGILHSLAYVGPLRDRPKRHYDTSGAIPFSVGSRGEDMANMIRRRIKDIKPKLDQWVSRFEFGSGVSVIDNNFGEFSLHFDQGRKRINIADSGFGVSQVLPLIVQALIARRNSLTIAEQPEIHLNPRLQSTLADLFVEMANTDHRVVVETHSEHLLLRLRRLVAKGVIDKNRVAIYFVEKTGAESTIREIPLDASGGIKTNEWPKGFFDDSLRESLAFANDQYQNRSRRESKISATKQRSGSACSNGRK